MSDVLDLFDVQGDLVKVYAQFGFFFGRYVCLNIRDGHVGRKFLSDLLPQITTGVTWNDPENPVPIPNTTTNVSFTYPGLKELGLPRASLVGFPEEFVMGMKKRKDILGDDGPSSPVNWDPVWRNSREFDRDHDVHMLVTIYAKSPELLEQHYQWLLGVIDATDGGVVLLKGHRGDDGAEDMPYQAVNAIFENGLPTPKEHFGYTDGISDPYYVGFPGNPKRVLGRGKQTKDGGWEPLATGEFVLGHIDEAQEYPPAPKPVLLARNGTYMVYRKLHENVATFDQYLEREGQTYPGGKELLAAKFVGRWRDNGAPLVSAPDAKSKAEWDAAFAKADDEEKDRMLSGFTYDQDMSGSRCPFSAHMRRINPRASLQVKRGVTPGSMEVNPDAFDTPGALANRRRLIRRGLPYGKSVQRDSDRGNHGIVIMMLNADINRQFEFVQQQWINYGNDFRAGNDKEILLGNHGKEFPSKAVLQVDPESDQAPYFLRNIPRLVETRGGDYFFMPSMTALRMIAKGLIDPT